MIGDAIVQAIIASIIVAAISGAAVTAALIYGLPWLWSVVKPWLHVITG
jgi:hypothetical protein